MIQKFSNPGTTALGATISTCTVNGMWNPLILSQCISSTIAPMALNSAQLLNLNATPVTKCIAIPSPINGRISYSMGDSNGYMAGTIATLVCDPGLI